MKRIKVFGTYFYYSNFYLFVPIIAYFLGCLTDYAIFFVSICFHEIGHIIFAKFMGFGIESLKIYPFGFAANLRQPINTKTWEYITVLAIGPVTNLFVAIIFYYIRLVYAPNLYIISFISTANLIIALLNLLPLIPLDGGKILDIILSKKIGCSRSFFVMRKSSIVFSFILIIIGIFGVFAQTYAASGIVVGALMLIKAYKDIERGGFMNLKDLLFRKQRILKKGVYEVRELVAVKSTTMSKLLGQLNHDRYHFINIIDENLNVLSKISEAEILDMIIENGLDSSVENILKSQKK